MKKIILLAGCFLSALTTHSWAACDHTDAQALDWTQRAFEKSAAHTGSLFTEEAAKAWQDVKRKNVQFDGAAQILESTAQEDLQVWKISLPYIYAEKYKTVKGFAYIKVISQCAPNDFLIEKITWNAKALP